MNLSEIRKQWRSLSRSEFIGWMASRTDESPESDPPNYRVCDFWFEGSAFRLSGHSEDTQSFAVRVISNQAASVNIGVPFDSDQSEILIGIDEKIDEDRDIDPEEPVFPEPCEIVKYLASTVANRRDGDIIPLLGECANKML